MTSNVRERRMRWPRLAFSTLVVLIVLALSPPALAGDLRAYFDRQSVYEGDTVTLVIETNGGNLGQPDLSGLGTDFDLLGTSQSTNISIVNGQRTDTVRLLVSLAPKHTGTIEVPPIPVGSDQTGPLRLQVSEVPEGGSGGGGDDIFVEMEVAADSGELMVQQQVPLTVRLYTAVPLLNGSLDDPRAEGALVTKLGEDRKYSTRRDGRDYQVVERRYTLSPEHSGELRIPPIVLEGSVRGNTGRRGGTSGSPFDDPFFDRFFQNSPLSGDPFGMFDRGEPVSARSRAITLDVKARPGEYAGDHWLPAQALEIVDSWSESPPELRVGEPATRTLTLRAKGLSGPQIPEIEIPAVQGLRVYPETPESETRSDGETVYGISRQSLTMIPSQSGSLVIPQIRVTWWDTAANQERVATVPGRTLNVTGGSTTQPATEQAEQAAQSPAPQAPDRPQDDSPEPATEAADNHRPALAAAAALVVLVLVLVLAGVFALLRRKRRASAAAATRPASRGNIDPAPVKGSEAKKALRAACEANNAPGAARALLDWGEATWPTDAPRNLGAMSARLTRGAEQVRELERRLYSPGPESWNGSALWQALQGGLFDAGSAKQRKGETLDPLYPQRT